MNTYTTSFDGALLKRGFWLYVCRIAYGRRSVLYVGRTGDSSSAHASSPFTRIGQHLGENTRNNSLTSQLKKAKLIRERCRFEMVAAGPLFPEQKPERHKSVRDKVGALEWALADHLKDAGHTVIGNHPSPARCNQKMLKQICRLVDSKLGALKRGR